MLEARGIRHVYAGKTVLAVDDWRAAAGEQWLVHGPSGCGKTTLLHILAGLLRPTAGEALVNGQALGALSGGALDRFRGRHIGIVLQRLHLIDALTVRQNMALARTFAGFGAADDAGRRHAPRTRNRRQGRRPPAHAEPRPGPARARRARARRRP